MIFLRSMLACVVAVTAIGCASDVSFELESLGPMPFVDPDWGLQDALEYESESIIAALDPINRIVYVSEKDRLLAMEHFEAKQSDGQWLITRNAESVAYTVKSLGQLADLPSTASVVKKNKTCAILTDKKDVCVFWWDPVRKSWISMKSPEGGVAFCKTEKNETCEMTLVRATKEIWMGKDCKGKSVTETRNFEVCTHDDN